MLGCPPAGSEARGVRSSDPDRCSHSMRVLPSYHIREYRTMRLETAYSVRSKRHEFCIHQAFTFTNASESPDVSSLLTCKISFGKWLINSVHSVKPHSFSLDNVTLPPSFNQIDCNTPTSNTPLNLTFFATSTVTYDENTPLWKQVMLPKALEKSTVHGATHTLNMDGNNPSSFHHSLPILPIQLPTALNHYPPSVFCNVTTDSNFFRN